MSLTREELDDMQKVLKEAFQKAKSVFNSNKHYNTSDADLRYAINAVGTTAAALLQVDARLREMEESSVTKLPSKNMPGK